MFSDKFCKFIAAADKDLNKGDQKEFECPLCNGQAHAIKEHNGNMRAYCEKCGYKVRKEGR